MTRRIINHYLLGPELVVTSARSGGPGGQNVNKVNSKVIVRFNVVDSAILTPEEKEIILRKLSSWVVGESELMIQAQEDRSQLSNKMKAFQKLDELLAKAFAPVKRRKPTKPSKGSVQSRISNKKRRSETKKLRGRPGID